MAGPIPVFSFVFAAYAATSDEASRAANSCVVVPLNPRDPFRAVWRTQSARGGAVFAKIRIARGSGLRDPHLAAGAAGEGNEEFWVGGIVESGLGFVGARVATADCPKDLSIGQRVRFHALNVLDWRIDGQPELCPRTHAPCSHREAAGEVPSLSEILPPLSETAAP
jgi:hypothetical protein